MANQSPQPADFEEEPLPEAKALNFDLSDQEKALDGIDAEGVRSPENELQGEPEGIFSLFDREFPEDSRSPVEPSESLTFDQEFSTDFDSMFENVPASETVPLFNSDGEPLTRENSGKNEVSPNAGADSRSETNSVVVQPNNELEASNETLPKTADTEVEQPLPASGGKQEDWPVIPANPFERKQSPNKDNDESNDANEIEESLPQIETSSILEENKLHDEDFDAKRFENEVTTEDESFAEDKPLLNLFDNTEEELSNELSEAWSPDENLEEINFDSSDDEYDELDSDNESEDDASDFDDFAKFALGLDQSDEEDTEQIDEEDDFKVEELGTESSLDPFEDVAIMSSEEVANYKSPFGEEELKFEEAAPVSDDPDPFEMNEVNPDQNIEEIDPFGEEAMALAESKEGKLNSEAENAEEKEDEAKPEKKKKKKNPRTTSPVLAKLFSFVWTIILVPWKIYSQLTTILFGLIEGFIKILAKIPLLGIPFKLLSNVLSSVPMAVKRIVVLAVIASTLWGGTTLISSMLPKPSAQIELPDYGGATISSVELKDAKIQGEIINTGDIDLNIAPIVEVSERKLSDPSSWFKPKGVGICEGDFIEVQINETKKISYDCSLEVSGLASLKPTLKD